MVGQRHRARAATPRSDRHDYVPLRHRFIDDHLGSALDDGAAQVVLLGAGYDTRAYRFADQLDGRPVFEVDLAADQPGEGCHDRQARGRVSGCQRRAGRDRLRIAGAHGRASAAGFAVDGSTFFAWEGVPMYLTRAAVKATLDAVHELSGAGSQIAHDMWYLVDDPGPLGHGTPYRPERAEPDRRARHVRRASGGLSRLPRRHGFRIVDLALASELQARYAAGARAAVDDSLYVLCAERVASRRRR